MVCMAVSAYLFFSLHATWSLIALPIVIGVCLLWAFFFGLPMIAPPIENALETLLTDAWSSDDDVKFWNFKFYVDEARRFKSPNIAKIIENVLTNHTNDPVPDKLMKLVMEHKGFVPKATKIIDEVVLQIVGDALTDAWSSNNFRGFVLLVE